MTDVKILWVDDEIDLLTPHFLFLKDRGYITKPCSNGQDALDLIKNESFDIVLLDENMPGLNGLETLTEIKKVKNELPVIMITKNEEEHIMNEAIGRKIADYLIKPVNPNQILLALKKIFSKKNIISEKISQDYQKQFSLITKELEEINSFDEWEIFYKKMIFWELELESSNDKSMIDIFKNQFKEANLKFFNFISKNYNKWLREDKSPVLSHQLFKKKISPKIENNKPCILLLIDNLRYDQWKIISSEITEFYKIESESSFMSILPSSTQYSRNSIFSGMTPLEISKKLPQFWINDNKGNSKNMFEKELLENQLKRLNQNIKFSYNKITESIKFKELIDNLNNNLNESLTVFVVNIIDIISHAKTEMKMIKELAPDIKAYRSLTLSWFKNSPLKELIIRASELGFNLILTSDHGTINVETPIETISDRNSSSNLRYKTGRSLTVNSKKVLKIDNPEDFELPKVSINSSYFFANQNQYFIYKNNYNKYVNYYKNSFQHGGISMEEMIVPFVFLKPK